MAKEPIKIYGGSGVLAGKVALFNQKATKHEEAQLSNPFSESWEGSAVAHHRAVGRLVKGDAEYGRPVSGSKADVRGKKAGILINSEISHLCDMIWEFGEKGTDGTAWITFGELFQIYSRISNKLVGLLLRARKHGILDFKGEMLFQRQDDHVVIGLVKSITEIRRAAAGGGGDADPEQE